MIIRYVQLEPGWKMFFEFYVPSPWPHGVGEDLNMIYLTDQTGTDILSIWVDRDNSADLYINVKIKNDVEIRTVIN